MCARGAHTRTHAHIMLARTYARAHTCTYKHVRTQTHAHARTHTHRDARARSVTRLPVVLTQVPDSKKASIVLHAADCKSCSVE